MTANAAKLFPANNTPTQEAIRLASIPDRTSTTTYTGAARKMTKKERKAQRKALRTLDEPNSRSMAAGLLPHRAEFLRMIAMCRPDSSKTEQAFIERYIEPLMQLEHVTHAARDYAGNYFLTVGDNPRLAFTSHVDTVHYTDGWQSLHYDHATGIVSLAASSLSNCLGADCTSGVWLMRQMILAAKPALYCFYRAEEIGCLGSEWSAKNDAERYSGIDAMISLDRRGFDEVITHQCCMRTCSDEFALSLAHQLNGIGLGTGGRDLGSYKPSDEGLYTDSREFVDVIPECTNISVGYFGQHGSNERQYLLHLDHLLQRLLVLDPAKLRIKRTPGSHDYDDSRSAFSYYRTPESYSRTPGTYKAGSYWAEYTSEDNSPDYGDYRDRPYGTDSDRADLYDASYSVTQRKENTTLENLETMVRNHPDIAARLLYDTGIGVTDFAEYVFESTGTVPSEAC